jgi:DNA-binding winged helix-turn-helix (wHTH) protein
VGNIATETLASIKIWVIFGLKLGKNSVKVVYKMHSLRFRLIRNRLGNKEAPVVSVISFNSFQFDLVNAQLRQSAQPISITPKSYAVLHYLLQHPGRLVTKGDLLAAVWPKSYVGDAVLKVCIREIRKALGDDIKTPRFIETAHRRGYRFIGKITYEESAFGDNQSTPGAAEQALNRLLAGADLSLFCDTRLTAS